MCVCCRMVSIWGKGLFTLLCVCALVFFYLSVCNDAWIVQLYSIDHTPVNSNCCACQCVLWDLHINTLACLSICSDLQEKQAMLAALSAYPVWSRHTLFPYGSTAWLVLEWPGLRMPVWHATVSTGVMPCWTIPSALDQAGAEGNLYREEHKGKKGALYLVLSKAWLQSVSWITVFKTLQKFR